MILAVILTMPCATRKPRASGDDPFMCVSNQEREG